MAKTPNENNICHITHGREKINATQDQIESVGFWALLR
jgi:hypothetical protein